MKLGSIEAGGTKFVCGIGDDLGNVHEEITIPTKTPEETIPHVLDFFRHKAVSAIGIGSFGPVDLNRKSDTYGYITSTPKPHWSQFDLVGTIQKAISVPLAFDTDVNAAALGELEWGAAKGLDSCLYMTVGTGIGVGAITERKLVHGLMHPEMGHIYTRRHPDDDFVGNCSFHKDCLEGMAAGPALEKRWGVAGKELSDHKQAWEFEAYYLAQALVNYMLTLSPKKIILGGGVMKQTQLFPLIHDHVLEALNGYLNLSELTPENIGDYIVPPALGDQAGLCGGLALAKTVMF
ncbi:fructokinase [Fictibacillus macauensis ZFHKF-1]|uniref:fructokinase n=1 Tax=Fictibacillus macauensis ZFHKF-1 TaxID=1196324 RepID=I8AE95_9BACL|nr:ROK family protein [Fictibacillus macauensis]EIT83912.1 fructokinase [Fictibacillus macauensis ZFHKF-1]